MRVMVMGGRMKSLNRILVELSLYTISGDFLYPLKLEISHLHQGRDDIIPSCQCIPSFAFCMELQLPRPRQDMIHI